ncbi:hypothetical protein ACFE04_025967 [Oxalis oulophora]
MILSASSTCNGIGGAQILFGNISKPHHESSSSIFNIKWTKSTPSPSPSPSKLRIRASSSSVNTAQVNAIELKPIKEISGTVTLPGSIIIIRDNQLLSFLVFLTPIEEEEEVIIKLFSRKQY